MKLAARATLLATSSALALTLASARVDARSFVTLTDNGTLAAKITSTDPITAEVLKAYDKTGVERPDVLSVWTNFSMDGNNIETLFDPLGNDVTGIGLDNEYGGDGTFTTDAAPVRAILLHNDFTQLAARAQKQGAPLDGFARYLFLLELSHLWGPAARLPVPDAGVDGGPPPSKAELIGFSFHWSFWMGANGSPAGGNAWKDNGDGTFTASGQSPKTVHYSMLDLYLMGLASPNEVPPFFVLESPNVTSGQMDPFFGHAFGQMSFPWFGDTPLTVSASRRTLTIDDVIAANGPRMPAKSNGALKLGVVLMLAKNTKPEDVAALEAAFEPIASSLAPAFADATGGRGSFTLVTNVKDPAATPDAGAPGADAGALADAPGGSSSGGCSTTTTTDGSAGAMLLGLLGAAALVASRRRLRQ
jgi:MYXO-CTERM domain-containing protein